MAITLTGSAGCQYGITTADTADATGTKTVLQQTEDSVRTVTFTDASKSVAFTGQVGTSGTEFDLFALADVTDATYTMRISSGTSGTSLTSILILCIHNKSAGTLTVAPGASNSFLTASEQITIPTGCAQMFSYGTAQTVSTTVKTFKITGSAINLDTEVYILGA